MGACLFGAMKRYEFWGPQSARSLDHKDNVLHNWQRKRFISSGFCLEAFATSSVYSFSAAPRSTATIVPDEPTHQLPAEDIGRVGHVRWCACQQSKDMKGLIDCLFWSESIYTLVIYVIASARDALYLLFFCTFRQKTTCMGTSNIEVTYVDP